MSFNEKIKFRTESSTYLSHEVIDDNFRYVANPWTTYRIYKEGEIVYHDYNDILTWFIAIVPTTTQGTFVYPDEWRSIIGIDPSSGTLSFIGTPSGGDYTDGYFPWVPTTTIANAFDNVNEIILSLLPVKPTSLFGLDLISNLTFFSAKMSDNIPDLSYWTCDGLVPGDTITNLTSDNSIIISLDNTDTEFYGGKKETYLIDNYYIYAYYINGNIIFDSAPTNYLLIKNGVDTDGILSLTDLDINYNNFWLKVNAEITNTLIAGYNQFKLSDDITGDSNTFSLYYTGTYPNPTVSYINCGINTPVYMYLSGIRYYTTGTTFNLSYTINNLYNPVYSLSDQSEVSSDYHITHLDNYVGIPNYNSQLIILNKVLTILANKTSNTSYGTGLVTVNKPDLSDVTQSYTLGTYYINSKGIVSTDTIEYFYDEDKRYSTYNLGIWTSSTLFSNTEEQLQVQNGRLIDPRFSGSYPAYTSTTNYYYRQFSGFTITDKGQLTITKNGLVDALGPWINGGGTLLQIRLYIRRSGIWTSYDMGLGIGLPVQDGGKGILDISESSDGFIRWAFTTENITVGDIVMLCIKFTNTLATDYITQLEMNWDWI